MFPINVYQSFSPMFWISSECVMYVHTAQKMMFPIEDFFSKCDQICKKLRIWSHLLKKSLMENFIFVQCQFTSCIQENDYSVFLNRPQNNYSYLKICFDVAQFTNRSTLVTALSALCQ